MTKEKAAAFLADYHKELAALIDRMNETSAQLESATLEARFIQEKELPEAVERRVLTGDKQPETKARKTLEKLQREQAEKSEDLAVLKNVIHKFKLKKVDELQPIFKLFQEEKRLIGKETYERMEKARETYQNTLSEESKLLHAYRKTETDLQQIEVQAGRRGYTEIPLPVADLKLFGLTVDRNAIIRLVKRL